MMVVRIDRCVCCGCPKVVDEGGMCRKCHVDYHWRRER
jgi:hypothetical protein